MKCPMPTRCEACECAPVGMHPAHEPLECGAPAMLDRSWFARGVDFDGGDIIVEMGRMRCVRGHTWDQVIETLPDVSDRIPDGLHLES